MPTPAVDTTAPTRDPLPPAPRGNDWDCRTINKLPERRRTVVIGSHPPPPPATPWQQRQHPLPRQPRLPIQVFIPGIPAGAMTTRTVITALPIPIHTEAVAMPCRLERVAAVEGITAALAEEEVADTLDQLTIP